MKPVSLHTWIKVVVVVLAAAVLIVLMGDRAQAHDTYSSTAAFLDVEVLAQHNSAFTGADMVYVWRTYGVAVLDQIVILGAETSLGDPKLGGRLVELNNFGCLREAGISPKWAEWSDGFVWIRGKTWYTYPNPRLGMMSWGRYMKVGADGRYPALLARNDWDGFAAIYYGAGVSGIGDYIDNLYKIQKKYRRLAAAHGFVW